MSILLKRKKKNRLKKRRKRDSIKGLPFRIVALGDMARRFYCNDVSWYKLIRFGYVKVEDYYYGWWITWDDLRKMQIEENNPHRRLTRFHNHRVLKLLGNKFYVEKAGENPEQPLIFTKKPFEDLPKNLKFEVDLKKMQETYDEINKLLSKHRMIEIAWILLVLQKKFFDAITCMENYALQKYLVEKYGEKS